MAALIECVPNFSEGRNRDTIAALEHAVRSVPGVHLLDVHTDGDHNRAVFTLVGGSAAIGEAAVRAVAVAVTRIDLREHRGQHPRMGAADVVPFVPLEGATLGECAALARRVGQRIGTELGVPVYLYGHAATRPERASLPAVRGRGFEDLLQRVGRDPTLAPDFGPPRLHPTAGATAVGARPVLVAFNVLLATGDVRVAQAVARAVRTSSGGLPAVQARGFLVQGGAQVSLNLLDVDVTPPLAVVEAIAREAARHGTEIVGSELVGLVPERAIIAAGAAALRLPRSVADKLLEPRLRALSGGADRPAGARAPARAADPGGEGQRR